MRLELNRFLIAPDAFIGTLMVNEVRECYTLENRDLAIPDGLYRVTAYNSPHAGHIVPLLENVLGRDHIEIHCGNQACDSKGCILVGQTHGSTSVSGSQIAFQHLLPQIMGAIKNMEPITISVH